MLQEWWSRFVGHFTAPDALLVHTTSRPNLDRVSIFYEDVLWGRMWLEQDGGDFTLWLMIKTSTQDKNCETNYHNLTIYQQLILASAQIFEMSLYWDWIQVNCSEWPQKPACVNANVKRQYSNVLPGEQTD